MTVHTFACPSCGASLTAQPHQSEVTCSFCGTSVIVPEELRAELAPTPQPETPPQMQPKSPPIIVVEPPPIVIQESMPTRVVVQRRRGGCGCCGPIIGLLVLAAIIALFVYIQRPAFAGRLLAQVESLAGSFSSTPQIIAFTATPVSNSGSVIAAWVTNADSVRLERITPQGTQTLPSLAAVGEHTFSLGNESGEMTFRLTATKNGKAETRSLNVTVRRRGTQ